MDFFHRTLLFLLLLFSSFLVSHFFIYKVLIIPRLLSSTDLFLSFGWTFLRLAPSLFVLFIFGAWQKNKFDLVMTALAGGWLWVGFSYILSLHGEPGFLKQYESLSEIWQRLVSAPLFMMIPLLIGYGVSRLFNRRRPLP